MLELGVELNVTIDQAIYNFWLENVWRERARACVLNEQHCDVLCFMLLSLSLHMWQNGKYIGCQIDIRYPPLYECN